MSQFYINSVKKRMKWQKLDLENLQEHGSDISGAGSNSVSDNMRYQDSNEREQAITELRLRLQDDFSHILNPNKVKRNGKYSKKNTFEKENNNISNSSSSKKYKNNFYSQASIALEQIESIAGIKSKKDEFDLQIEKSESSPQVLLGMISKLRVLTKKRSKIKSHLASVDNDLIKLQEKIIEDKKIYEEKISYLQSINEIYSQSSRLVSKIISEESDYEQL